MPGGERPVIELSGVTKVYGEGDTTVHALRGVTLGIERGDYVAIMGASGSGKSTLMNIIGCLDTPSAGRYRLVGTDVSTLGEDEQAQIRNKAIGFVFQSFNLIPRTSAVANVELPLAYARIGRDERRRRAVAALEMVGLGDRLDHLPSQLSGGQAQRVAIARAVVNRPALVLADEPTGALDSVSTAEVLGLFDHLNVQGRTLIVITHEDEVAAHAKRVIRLRDGAVISDERQAGVRRYPPLLGRRHGAPDGAAADLAELTS